MSAGGQDMPGGKTREQWKRQQEMIALIQRVTELLDGMHKRIERLEGENKQMKTMIADAVASGVLAPFALDSKEQTCQQHRWVNKDAGAQCSDCKKWRPDWVAVTEQGDT